MWGLFEPVHAIIYAPSARPMLEEAGLRGFWRGYFACRCAPLGAVGPGPVLASFFGFAPSVVNRALPDVWQRITPERTLTVRERAAAEALRTMGAPPDEAGVLLGEAAAAAEHSGRVLSGANAALPVPDEPVARLWHAATVLREHRGDGHFAALVVAGVSGIESLVLRSGLDLSRDILQPARGWTDEQWQAAAAGLVERGLLDEAGRATAAGVELYRDVEDVTDRCATGPWRALGTQATDRLAEMLAPLASACLAVSPVPNLLGLPGWVQNSNTLGVSG
ncbi:SCO6745 family protein [Rugosimonospora africana]